jgi:hypothetical protein
MPSFRKASSCSRFSINETVSFRSPNEAHLIPVTSLKLMHHSPKSFASPLQQGERIKVRGWAFQLPAHSQTLTLPSPLERERRTWYVVDGDLDELHSVRLSPFAGED